MNLKEKFDECKKTGGFKRLKGYQVDIFIGYDENGNMAVAITENGKKERISSSKFIKVTFNTRTDGKLILMFSLTDKTYEDIYLKFCNDLIESCECAGQEVAISCGVLRWKYWQSTFSKKKSDILSEEEIKGLIGELYIVKNHFFRQVSIEDSIRAWLGPLGGHKDFEIDDTWYEIKSTNESSIQITINSLEQLESDIDGYLFIVRLERTSDISTDSLDLNTIIKEISKTLSDPNVMDLYLERLNAAGYEYSEEYDAYKYRFKGIKLYLVNDSFPRLRKNEINPSIIKAEYSILIDGISEFEEKIV